MSEQLAYSMFQQVLFPTLDSASGQEQGEELLLKKVVRYTPNIDLGLHECSLVIFDFETTGLDAREDQIIEIGAQKLVAGKVVAEFSHLIKPSIALSKTITNITGITPEMLEDKPLINEILPQFLQFIEGSLLAAHNAEFDMGFLRQASQKLGYELFWPCFCTLKLARTLLPQLESKSLDALAEYYDLSFEARHRSIGDVKVTSSVLFELLANEGEALKTWNDLQLFTVAED